MEMARRQHRKAEERAAGSGLASSALRSVIAHFLGHPCVHVILGRWERCANPKPGGRSSPDGS